MVAIKMWQDDNLLCSERCGKGRVNTSETFLSFLFQNRNQIEIAAQYTNLTDKSFLTYT